MSRPIDITIAGEVATVRTRGSQDAAVARVLGTETRDGKQLVYLDAELHRPDQEWADGWTATGAITTILMRDTAPG
jgi:hypothetical protein